MNNLLTSPLVQPGLLILVVVIVHASLQVGVSVLTLLSGHSFRKKQAHSRLVRLNLAYTIGAILISFLVLIALQALLRAGHNDNISPLWPVIGFAMVITGIIIAFSYYRRGKGTVLWLPRNFATYLSNRAKKTRNSIEAGALGGMTVIAELPISLLLFLTIALLSYSLDSHDNIWWALGYAIAINLPLIIITILIGGGHRISQIQRWRENNKTFIRYNAGLGMIAAAIYIISFYILEVR